MILTEEASFRRAVRRKSLISLICLGCSGHAGTRNSRHRADAHVARTRAHAHTRPDTHTVSRPSRSLVHGTLSRTRGTRWGRAPGSTASPRPRAQHPPLTALHPTPPRRSHGLFRAQRARAGRTRGESHHGEGSARDTEQRSPKKSTTNFTLAFCARTSRFCSVFLAVTSVFVALTQGASSPAPRREARCTARSSW